MWKYAIRKILLALPVLLGITMWAQFRLNPPATDPVQQQMFALMPWIMMFIMAPFAAGLLLYWITNNTITIAQQYAIMSMHGHRPDLFGNIKSSLPARAKSGEKKGKSGK